MTRSLGGVPVLVTRPAAQAARFAALLTEARANPGPFPAIEIEPVELDAEARARLAPDSFDRLFAGAAETAQRHFEWIVLFNPD